MTPQERKRVLQAFHRALQDRPLDPADADDAKRYVRELHVSRREAGLEIDPVARLAAQIEREAGSRVWLFTGNIGSGKSTELRRLRQSLRESPENVVFLTDAADYINLNQKIEIADFLISVTAAFAEQAGGMLGDDVIARGYWERIVDFLRNTAIEIREVSAGAGAEANVPGVARFSFKGDLKAALIRDPVVKERIQKQLRGHLAALAQELELFRGQILDRLRSRFGKDIKVVLVIDSLERLRGTGDANDDVFSSVRTMFSQYPDMLRLAELQTVYSVAPYLIKLAPHLAGVFGAGALCHLTTAHVFQARSREPDREGIGIIREIVTRRYEQWEELISPKVLDQVIEASGGDLRDLFRMLSILLLELEFSTDVEAALRYTLNQIRRDMTWITTGHLERLRHLATAKAPRLESDADMDALVHDLETKRVLMYRNGEDWYDVHPLLREQVERPLPGSAAGGG